MTSVIGWVIGIVIAAGIVGGVICAASQTPRSAEWVSSPQAPDKLADAITETYIAHNYQVISPFTGKTVPASSSVACCQYNGTVTDGSSIYLITIHLVNDHSRAEQDYSSLVNSFLGPPASYQTQTQSPPSQQDGERFWAGTGAGFNSPYQARVDLLSPRQNGDLVLPTDPLGGRLVLLDAPVTDYNQVITSQTLTGP